MLPHTISAVWVSVEARSYWSPVFQRLNESIIDSTLAGVHEGKWQKRSLKLFGSSWLTFLSLVKKYNVHYSSRTEARQLPGSRVCYDVTIAHPAFALPQIEVAALAAAEQCSLWELALKSPGGRQPADCVIEHDATPLSILFWQDMGINLFAEMPEQLGCPHYTALITSHLDWMDFLHLTTESGQIKALLSSPMEWSSLHGIEELRFPFMKLLITGSRHVCHTKHIIRISGETYPEHSAYGLEFPYRKKCMRPVSDSKSFKKGIDHNTRTAV